MYETFFIKLVPYLVTVDRRFSNTDANVARWGKLVWGNFLNQAFLLWTVHLLISAFDNSPVWVLWVKSGFLDYSFALLFNLLIFLPIIMTLDIPNCLKGCKRMKAMRRARTGSKPPISQEELNFAMERSEFDLEKVYVRVNVAWHTMLFLTPLFPVTPLVVSAYLIYSFFFMKYRVLRRSRVP